MVDVGVERRGAEGGEEPAGVPDGGEPVLFCMGFGSPCRLGVRVGEYEQGWRHTKDAMTDLKMEGGEAEENGAMVRRSRLEEGTKNTSLRRGLRPTLPRPSLNGRFGVRLHSWDTVKPRCHPGFRTALPDPAFALACVHARGSFRARCFFSF